MPTGDEHPSIERRTDDAVSLDHSLELLVAELAVARHQRAAVAMAGPDGAAKQIHRLIERLVAQVGDVENDAEALHLAEQIRSRLAKRSAFVRARRVGARAVMRRAKRAQAGGVGLFQMAKGDHRVGPLETEHIADWERLGWAGFPLGQVRLELLEVGDLCQLCLLFHFAIPSQLALCLCPGLSWRVPTGQRVVALGVAGDLRPNTKADVSATHLRQADCALAAVRFVGLAGLAFANFYEWPRQVAVPLERVHRQVEVDVKNKWGFFPHDRAPAAWPSAATVNGRNCIL